MEKKKISPHKLYEMAGGDRDKYRALMIEHGHLIPKLEGHRRLDKGEMLQEGDQFWDDLDSKFYPTKCAGFKVGIPFKTNMCYFRRN